MRFGAYSEDDARKIHRKVLGKQEAQNPVDIARNQTVHNSLYYVLLTEDLDPATNPLTGYTTAVGRIIRYIQPVDPAELTMEESTSSQGLIEITNRNLNYSASIGDVLLIIRNGSEWSPVASGGGVQLYHGIVTQICDENCQTYKVRRVHRYLTADCEDCDTGTGTGTGTGT